MSAVDPELFEQYKVVARSARQLWAMCSNVRAMDRMQVLGDDRPKRVSSRSSKKPRPRPMSDEDERHFITLDAEGTLPCETVGHAEATAAAINVRLDAIIRPHLEEEIAVLKAYAKRQVLDRETIDQAFGRIRQANNFTYTNRESEVMPNAEGLLHFDGKGGDVKARRMQVQINAVLHEYRSDRLLVVMTQLAEIANKL